jgi:hypothetical protein
LEELDRMIESSASCCSSSRERLAYLIREHVRVMTEELEGSPLAFEVSALSPDRRDEIIAGRDRYEAVLRDIVSAGIRSGELRKVDPKMTVFAILGAINWIARWYDPEGGTEGPDVGAVFADLLIRGLVP